MAFSFNRLYHVGAHEGMKGRCATIYRRISCRDSTVNTVQPPHWLLRESTTGQKRGCGLHGIYAFCRVSPSMCCILFVLTKQMSIFSWQQTCTRVVSFTFASRGNNRSSLGRCNPRDIRPCRTVVHLPLMSRTCCLLLTSPAASDWQPRAFAFSVVAIDVNNMLTRHGTPSLHNIRYLMLQIP